MGLVVGSISLSGPLKLHCLHNETKSHRGKDITNPTYTSNHLVLLILLANLVGYLTTCI